jgi:hypothetical protein
VLIANFDRLGRLAGHSERAFRANLDEATWTRLNGTEYGLTYNIVHPVISAGAYHVRAGVRDMKSGKLGTATQFLTVPDLKDKKFKIGGLLVAASKPEADVRKVATPEIRMFQRGQGMIWQAQVFNPKLNKRAPNLRVNVKLYRNGVLSTELPSKQIEPEQLDRGKRDLYLRGELALSANAAPGEYAIEVVVSDLNDKSKTTSAAIDFEIVP